jgi:hypothetical protein
LFFNSNDALVPQDINGAQDVYEFEPAGIGGCTTASLTFSVAAGGCVGLITSGSSTTDSSFMDASEGGDSVFFLTGERLVPEDTDTSLDIYDARVCTAAAPCPNPAVSTPACTTADACRAAPSPQPPIFGATASATFSGAGNVTSPTGGSGVGTRSLTRAQKLTAALRACHKKRGKRKRAVCEREARKRYGAKSARKAATKRGRG